LLSACSTIINSEPVLNALTHLSINSYVIERAEDYCGIDEVYEATQDSFECNDGAYVVLDQDPGYLIYVNTINANKACGRKNVKTVTEYGFECDLPDDVIVDEVLDKESQPEEIAKQNIEEYSIEE